MSGDANGKLLIVDADAHVVECDRTWDYLEPSEQQFRPVPLAAPEDGGVTLQFWLVDGKVRGATACWWTRISIPSTTGGSRRPAA